MVAADHRRHGGDDPGGLRRRSPAPPRLADLEDQPAIEAFAAELIDRFGPLPDEVVHLLQIVTIKGMCRKANVAKVDVGPKGAVIAFRDNVFPNPGGLVRWIGDRKTEARIRPDQSVVFIRDWEGVAGS